MKKTMTSFKPIFFLLLQLWFSSVQAHAFIEQQQPKAGEELNSPPTAIILTYNKNIEPAFSTIQIVKEESQTPIETGKAEGVQGEPNKLILPLPALTQGEYHVSWVALSRDGHRTMGDYTFTVR
jgi:copper resistance protein C